MKEFIRIWTFATASFLSVFSISSEYAPYPYPPGVPTALGVPTGLGVPTELGVPTGQSPPPLPSPFSGNPYGVLPPNSASLYPPPSRFQRPPQGPLPGQFPPLSPLPPAWNIRPSSRRLPQGNGMSFFRGSFPPPPFFNNRMPGFGGRLPPMVYSPEISSIMKKFISPSFVHEEIVTTINSSENETDATMNETVPQRFQDVVTKMEASDVITSEEKELLNSVMAQLQTQTNLNGDNEKEDTPTDLMFKEKEEKKAKEEKKEEEKKEKKAKEEKKEEEKKEKQEKKQNEAKKQKKETEEIIGKSAEDEANEEMYDNPTMIDLLAALPSKFSNHYGALTLVSMGVAVSGVILFVGMMTLRRRTPTTVVDNPEAYGPLV